MEPTLRMTGGELMTVRARRQAVFGRLPDPDLSVPDRGTTGPIPIGDIMEPLQKIIRHPDRNRLIAKFFSDNR